MSGDLKGRVNAEAEKAVAAAAAAALVENGMTVGLGTGSTASLFVRALAARALSIRVVATSGATADLARGLGMTVVELDEAGPIDLTVDGADEIGPGLALIKGGGGALLREKLVWEASSRVIVIANSAKRVAHLGAFPLPVEVVAFGHATTGRRIVAALSGEGMDVRARWRTEGGEAMRTDGGNLICDLDCGLIGHPAALARTLKGLTGVVDHGLFLNLTERALVGAPGGVETLYP